MTEGESGFFDRLMRNVPQEQQAAQVEQPAEPTRTVKETKPRRTFKERFKPKATRMEQLSQQNRLGEQNDNPYMKAQYEDES